MEDKFHIIVITTDGAYPDEGQHINNMLSTYASKVHLRKPQWSRLQMEALIRSVDAQNRSRLVLHSHFELCTRYGLGGIHLGRGRTSIPTNHVGTISYSCHSIAELEQCSSQYDYCTLSPIFDSISKQGYRAAFTPQELEQAKLKGIITPKVYALGGITFNKIDTLKQYGFSGACLLGAAWK